MVSSLTYLRECDTNEVQINCTAFYDIIFSLQKHFLARIKFPIVCFLYKTANFIIRRTKTYFTLEDHLFQLIKSLSMNEKRYFKLFANLQTGEGKNYMIVFEYYDEMEHFDENVLWSSLKGHFSEDKNKFAVTKNYLYKLILKSLRFSQENNYLEHKLYNSLLEANILEKKGLYKQSAKLLRSLKKQAHKYEMHSILIELLRKQILSNFDSQTKKLEEIIDQSYEEMELTLSNYQNELGFEKLSHQLFTQSRQKGRVRKDDKHLKEKVAQIIKNPLFNNAKAATTFNAKYLFNYSKFLYFYLFRKDSKKAYAYSKEVISTWEAKPEMIKAYPKRYKIHLSNYLNNCFSIGQLDEFPKYIRKFKSFSAKSFDEEAEDFQNIYFIELLYLLNTFKLKEAVKLVPAIEEGLKRYGGKINKSRELTFYHNITITFFFLEDFTNALIWQNKILFDPKSEIRRGLQNFASILQLVYHYELENDKVLEYLYDNTYRNLRRKGQLFKFEKIVLENILKLMKAVEKKEKQACFIQFRKDLLEFKENASEQLMGMTEVMIWLEARINGQSLLEAFEENA